jgi:hypothetical protein
VVVASEEIELQIQRILDKIDAFTQQVLLSAYLPIFPIWNFRFAVSSGIINNKIIRRLLDLILVQLETRV